MKRSKRLLAMAVCLLMAFGCLGASAESGFRTTTRWTADAEQMAELFAKLGPEGARAAELAPDIAKLLESLILEISGTENGKTAEFCAALRTENAALADIAFRVTEDGRFQVASSLLPGTVVDLTGELERAMGQAQQDLNGALAMMNFLTQKTDALMAELTAWAEALDGTEAYGSFSGDAYRGGLYRKTLRFDDRDLGLLGIRLLDVLDGLEAHWADWTEVRDSLRADLLKTASENALRYVLAAVRGADDAFVGLSLTVFRGEDQILTGSVGTDRLVIGWGAEEKVWYAELRGMAVAPDDLTAFLTKNEPVTVTGEFSLWSDPDHLGFRTVSADEGRRLFRLTLDALKLTARESASIEADATLTTPAFTLREHDLLTQSGSQAQLFLGDAEEPFMTGETVHGGEPVPYEWPDSEPLTPADGEKLQEILQNGIGALSLRLIGVVPMSLLTLLVRP